MTDELAFSIVEQNILPISYIAPIGFQTYYLRFEYNLSFWDSLVVASALENNCTALYTEDMQHQQIIKNQLTVINPLL